MKPTATLASLCMITALQIPGSQAIAQNDFDAQDIVDKIVALQQTIDDKQMTAAMHGDDIIDKFDVNRYFTVLDRLHPDAGLILDWVYWNGGIGGHPVLYLRAPDAPPFADFDAFDKATLPEARNNQPFNYLEQIHAADSHAGFFQLVVLRLLGDRFCLFWHEYYNEIALVCSPAGWQAILQRERNRGKPYTPPPPDFITAAEKLDFAPRIQMDQDQVTVDVITYCPFRGLERRHFEISRPFPHRIQATASTNLLSLSQRFVF